MITPRERAGEESMEREARRGKFNRRIIAE
jgi:hypothetical protein